MAYQKLHWVDRFQSSSSTLGIKAFCLAKGLQKSSLHEWIMDKAKLLKEDSKSKRFKPDPYTKYKEIETKVLF